jgi:Fe-S-cluster-containing hydrogenase component 2
MLACPNAAIVKASRPGWKGIAKCDLCPDREIPACVTICPNEALLFGEEWEWEAMQVAGEPLRIPEVAGGHHG